MRYNKCRMKEIGQGLRIIAKEKKTLFALMLFDLIAAVVLAIFCMVQISPGAAVTKVGYGDIGGYRDGMWAYPFAFALFALVMGVGHNLIAVRVFQKNGTNTATIFMGVTLMLLISSFIVFGRLLGEG